MFVKNTGALRPGEPGALTDEQLQSFLDSGGFIFNDDDSGILDNMWWDTFEPHGPLVGVPVLCLLAFIFIRITKSMK